MAKFKKASADEARAKRKDMIRAGGMGDLVVKGFRSPRTWNPDERSAVFTMSSESVDRYGDIVNQSGLNTDRFLENPQGLLFHNSRSWPCGQWSDINKVLNGRPKRTEGKLTFLPEGTDEDADRAARHVAAGTLRTVSIGFAPNWDEIEFILDDDDDWTGGFKFNESELLECSVVPIPAQPDALVKDAGGDMTLARDLIEEVLDSWAKTPEGLLVPMDDYRAKHLDLVGERGFHVIRGISTEPKTTLAEDLELKAETAEQAAAYQGQKVRWHPTHAENKGDGIPEFFRDCVGEVFASYIVDEGEFKGVHALAVEWSKEGVAVGMYRGLRAARVLLVKSTSPAEEVRDDPDGALEVAVEAFVGLALPGDEVKAAYLQDESEFRIVLMRGDLEVEHLAMPDSMTVGMVAALRDSIDERVPAPAEPETAVEPIAPIKIELDASQAREELGAITKLMDAVAAKWQSLFKRSDVERIEPEVKTPVEPPTPERTAAARAEADALLKRLAEKGLIEA